VQSQPGVGSRFLLDLAFERADMGAGPTSFAETTVNPAALEPEGGLRILVAEDNSVNQVLIRAMLSRLGHYQDVVGDGLEALHQVQAAPYDLVLMDVQMPQMDGIAATRAIRALPGAVARIPIIAMTANVMSEDQRACTDAGMDGFVGKPIDRAQLREVIETCSRRPVAPEA
jgi:CheY-like chemotaxis protein